VNDDPRDDLVRRGLAAGAGRRGDPAPGPGRDGGVGALEVPVRLRTGGPLRVTCPPHSPAPEQTRRLLGEYETVLLLRYDVHPGRAEWRKPAAWVLERALRLERELFLLGHHKAFTIVGGRTCDLEEPCGVPGTCTSREHLRPGPAGCGIDVFATSAAAGWPLEVVPAEGEPYHRYAFILVD
jgi:predicted metal-binding protein